MACRPMPPSEQPRVFISYARKDGAALAQRLHFPRLSSSSSPATPAATSTSSASKNRNRRNKHLVDTSRLTL